MNLFFNFYSLEYDPQKRAKRYQNLIQRIRLKAAFVRIWKWNKSFKRRTRKRLKLQTEIVKKKAIIDQTIAEIKRIQKNIKATYENVKRQLRDLYKNAKQQEYKIGLALLHDFNVSKIWRGQRGCHELENIPCQCDTCLRKNHVYIWCDRIIWQREEKRNEYTCPCCQKQIHHKKFNKHFNSCIPLECRIKKFEWIMSKSMKITPYLLKMEKLKIL